jgi:hypothetical protein
MRFAKMPEDTGAVLSEPETESEEEESSGDESEVERERKLDELQKQVSSL